MKGVKQRQLRNLEIVRGLSCGELAEALARRFNLTATYILTIGRCENGVTGLRQLDVKRLSLDRKIAGAARAGLDLREIAEGLGVSSCVVRASCERQGVVVRRAVRISYASYRVIAMMQQGKTQTAIANTLNVSRQAINQIVQNCRRHGVNISNAPQPGEVSDDE